MTFREKKEYLNLFAAKHGLLFNPEGECGILRECVGLSKDNHWISYNPTSYDTWDYIDEFYCAQLEHITPPDAYHKFECLAVLGRGEDAISQLYDWVVAIEELGEVSIGSYKTTDDAMQALFSGWEAPVIKVTPKNELFD